MKYPYMLQAFTDLTFWFDNAEHTKLKIISSEIKKNSCIYQCSVFVDLESKVISYDVTHYGKGMKKVIHDQQSSFTYLSERSAMRWLTSNINMLWVKLGVLFYFKTTLYDMLQSQEDARVGICNFIKYYETTCERVDLKQELSKISNIKYTLGPKEFSEKLLKKAPKLSRVIADYLKKRNTYYQVATLEYLANHIGEKE